MEQERYEQFTLMISGIYRCMEKIKTSHAETLGLKSVHIFWMYLLRSHPEGLTASHLARKSKVNRSLVSREIEALTEKGYIAAETSDSATRYGWRFILTDNGREVAERISLIALEVQRQVDSGIPQEDLRIFYCTLGKLFQNFENVVN